MSKIMTAVMVAVAMKLRKGASVQVVVALNLTLIFSLRIT